MGIRILQIARKNMNMMLRKEKEKSKDNQNHLKIRSVEDAKRRCSRKIKSLKTQKKNQKKNGK